MLALPLKIRPASSLGGPCYRLLGRQDECMGEVHRGKNSFSYEDFFVTARGGAPLLATVSDARPYALGASRIDLLDAQSQRIGQVGVPAVSPGLLYGRFQADIYGADGRRKRYTLTENSLLLRMARNVMELTPWLDVAKSYLALPSYTLTRPGGAIVARLTQTRSLRELSYDIDPVERIAEQDTALVALSLMTLALLVAGREGDGVD